MALGLWCHRSAPAAVIHPRRRRDTRGWIMRRSRICRGDARGWMMSCWTTHHRRPYATTTLVPPWGAFGRSAVHAGSGTPSPRPKRSSVRHWMARDPSMLCTLPRQSESTTPPRPHRRPWSRSKPRPPEWSPEKHHRARPAPRHRRRISPPAKPSTGNRKGRRQGGSVHQQGLCQQGLCQQGPRRRRLCPRAHMAGPARRRRHANGPTPSPPRGSDWTGRRRL